MTACVMFVCVSVHVLSTPAYYIIVFCFRRLGLKRHIQISWPNLSMATASTCTCVWYTSSIHLTSVYSWQ